MTLDLHLLGVAFGDLDGGRRLWKALHEIKPDVIGIEYDDDRVDSASKREVHLDITGAPCNPHTVRQLAAQAHYGFWIPRFYATKRNIPLLNHDGKFYLDTLGIKDGIYFLQQTPDEARKIIEEIYTTSSRYKLPCSDMHTFDDDTTEILCSDIHALDDSTAESLRQLSGRVLYIANVIRLDGKYRNLTDKVQHLNPTVRKLNEF